VIENDSTAAAHESTETGAPDETGAIGTDHTPRTPAQVWREMVRGNDRFVAGEPRHPRQDVERRTATAQLQTPHAALFGSRARGDARPDSDTDIMIEIDPEARIGVWGYAGLKEYIASLFDGPVDVVNRDGLKPYVRPAATADAIYAF